MANREVRLITKNSPIVDRPLPSSLLAGEAIVNTAQGIVFFSGVTQSSNNWVPSSNANFFEVGSNLYNLKIRNKIVSYGELNDLSGKFLSGTTSGFSLANISDIKGFDTFLTGGTYSSGTTIFKNNTGGTFSISGYSTGYTLTENKIINALGYTPLSAYTDTFLTGFTYQNTTNTLEITLNDGSIFNTSINEMSGMTFNGSVSATTYYGDGSNLTGINATEVTGFTFNTSNYELGLGQNNNNNFTVDLSILSSDITITGGTYNSNNGTATFTNNSGGTFDVTGFLTGFTDIYTTGVTYDDLTGVATFTRNDGNNYTLSGLYTGSTYIIPNLQEVTDSGNTTTNDIIVDAGGNYVSYITQSSIGSSYLLTYSAELSGNGSLNLVSLGGGGAGVLTAALVPYPNVVQLEFPNKPTGSYTIATIDDIPNDRFVTGFTNSNNVFTILDNTGQDYSTKLNILTGLTINGTLSATTINGNGSALTGIYPSTNPSGFTSNIGTVTSVGLTVPSALNVTPSSITTSGTFAITGAGTSGQYVRGDGALGVFPTIGGGGGGSVYYLNGNTSQGSIDGTTMYQFSKTPGTGADANFTGNTIGTIASFITDIGDPNQLTVPSGIWLFHCYFSETDGGSNHATIQAVVEKWDGTSITVIGIGVVEVLTNGSTKDLYTLGVTIPNGVTLALTDRIVIQIQIVNANGKTVTLYTENGDLSSVLTTFANGISSINGLTAAAQTLAVGTTGTDFDINSVGAIHTFNLPTASATNRGALSSTDWTTFNNKLSATITSPTGGDTLQYNATTAIWENSKPFWTVDLMDLSSVEFYAVQDVKINTITNIVGSPTITIADDGAPYTLTNTILSGSKITVTTNTPTVIKLNITY